MQIDSYEDLIMAAMSQPEPQRLLFVFARSELPEGYSLDQQERFERGEGGVLSPVLCVDKLPGEVMHFNELVAESENTGIHWDVAFVSSMAGRAGFPPSSDEASQPLQMMMSNINSGMIAHLLTFNRNGEMIALF